MKSEDIKAMGLREGDAVRVTRDHTILRFDYDGDIVTSTGLGIALGNIIAIERVMPELPEGWEWGREMSATRVDNGEVMHTVQIGRDGTIVVIPADPGRHPSHCIPASVAKALLEVWERREENRKHPLRGYVERGESREVTGSRR